VFSLLYLDIDTQLLMKNILLRLYICTTLLVSPVIVQGDTNFKIEKIAKGLDTVWGIAFLSTDELIFTEKSGSVRLLNLSSLTIIPLAGVPIVKNRGQGGMLDVAVPPQYKTGSWIYFTYSKPVGKYGVTTLARAKLNNTALVEWQDLVITRSGTNTHRHYGSRIAFDETGHLFFSIGDRGERPNGQDLSTHAGSVLRVNLDGTVPPDNPFLNVTGARPEIYSYGHRNPQGLAYDAHLKRLWLIEHGPRGGDEINLIKAGGNYGWPTVSHGKEYYGPIAIGEGSWKNGMEPAKKVYIPSIAPGSLMLYSGKAFPEWQGNLFAGALKLKHVNRIDLDDKGNPIAEERLLTRLDERIRCIVESPEGFIYFSTDSGSIYRLRP
jgi:glucose/arabinose dehydrogenase